MKQQSSQKRKKEPPSTSRKKLRLGQYNDSTGFLTEVSCLGKAHGPPWIIYSTYIIHHSQRYPKIHKNRSKVVCQLTSHFI